MAFLTPLASLVALAVVVPLVANVVLERRAGRVAAHLGLASAPLRTRIGLPVAITLIAALLGVAAAQPVISQTTRLLARTDAEAYVLFDTSRSMLAKNAYTSPSRLSRAKTIALELFPRLGDVPIGIASLTDRVVPHLFPTVDRQVFAATLRDSIGIQRPPPLGSESVATDYGTLGDIVTDNFYKPQTKKRLLIIFSDGESRLFDYAGLHRALHEANIHVLLVHEWSPQDRIFLGPGTTDPGYRPDPKGNVYARRLAEAGDGSVVRPDASAVEAAANDFLGRGRTVSLREQRTRKALAPFVALAALLPLGFVILRRNV